MTTTPPPNDLRDKLRMLIRAEVEPMIGDAIERIERTLLVLAKRYDGEARTALIDAAGAVGAQRGIYCGVSLKPPVDMTTKPVDKRFGPKLWTEERRAKFNANREKQMNMNDERNKKIVQDYKDSLTTRQLCEKYRLSEQTIYDVLRNARKAGELPPAQSGRRPNPMVAERDKKIQKLIEQGLNYRQIAVRLGISHSSVVQAGARLRAAAPPEPVAG